MSRRAVVSVPASWVSRGWGTALGVTLERWLTASFTLTGGTFAPVVEGAGTLRDRPAPPEGDPLLRGFHAACTHGRRPLPRGLLVRASSHIPLRRGLGASAAAVVAGVVAANALYGLALGDHDVAGVAARVLRGPAQGTHTALATWGGTVVAHAHASDPLHVTPIDVHPALALVIAVPECVAAWTSANVRTEDAVRRVMRAALAAGAVGAVPGRDGATIVAIGAHDVVETVRAAMVAAWRDAGVAAEVSLNPSRVAGHRARVQHVCDDHSAAPAAAHPVS